MNNVNLFNAIAQNQSPQLEMNYHPVKVETESSFQSILENTKNSIDDIDRSVNADENKKEESDINNLDNNEKSENRDIEKVNTEDNDDEKKIDRNKADDVYSSISELSEENENIDIKEKLKNIKELIAKLTEKETEDFGNDEVSLANIESLKKLISELEDNINIKKEDKDELKNIIAALSLISDKLNSNTYAESIKESTKDVVPKENMQKADLTTKEDIKNIKEKLNEIIENIEKELPSEINDNTAAQASSINKENETVGLFNDKVEKSEKTKVQSDGRIDSTSQNSNSNDATEITIVRMKDSVYDISSKLSNDSNIKTENANKSNTLENAKQFNELMSKLVDKAKIAMSEGRNEVVMTLKPERLGDVRLKIYLEGDDVNAKIFVDNAEIKDLFTKNIDTVIKSLSEVNISVGGFDVMLRDDMPKEDMEEFRALLEKGAKKTSALQKQNEAESTIKTIEKYALPERRLNLVV